MTKADLARELNVTTAAVNVWLKRGLPTDARGQFDRECALEWVSSHIEPQVSSGESRGATRAAELLHKGRKHADDHSNGHGNGRDALANPALARARRDLALAERLERANLREAGQLVTIEQAVAGYAQACVVIKSRLLGLAAKIAPRAHAAAAEGGTQAVYDVIHREVVEALRELSSPDVEDAA